MTRLSVNINKIATLRNARGGNVPDVIQVAKDAQSFGAQGITIHPRPDERHIRYQDAVDLKPVVHWDTIKHQAKLKEIIAGCKNIGVRTSIFVAPDLRMIEGAAACGTDRIELYTEAYAHEYVKNREKAVAPYAAAAGHAHELGLGVNAGHDLSLDNIEFFAKNVPHLAEVSIGHALICESLYQGLEVVIKGYLKRLAQ